MTKPIGTLYLIPVPLTEEGMTAYLNEEDTDDDGAEEEDKEKATVSRGSTAAAGGAGKEEEDTSTRVHTEPSSIAQRRKVDDSSRSPSPPTDE